MKEDILIPSSTWEDTWKKFKQNRIALVGLVMLSLIIASVIFIPMISPYTWNQVDGTKLFDSPNSENWFGTTRTGNDLFVNIWYGGRQSLFYASITTLLYLFVGTFTGLISGFFGKKTDTIINGVMDFIHALPLIPILIVGGIILNFRGVQSSQLILSAMLVYGFCSTPILFKIIRNQVKQLQSLEFMQAANHLGISRTSQIFKHLLPNVLSHVVVSASLMMSQAILIELLLFFVGIGYNAGEFNPLRPTWGNLVPNIRGVNIFRRYYWLSVFPILTIAFTTTSFKLIGEGLREALDPKYSK
jgi:ABC-type dipeptide/oligopeptide/nickel transport system permease subunit